MRVRNDIADFVDDLLWVYTLCIFGYIVSSLLLSFGVRLPYSRILDAVLSFLRDVSEPFLRIFRRLGLQIGPLDLSPIAALFVLRIVGSLVVGLIRP
jgi:YggT family protein